MVESHPLTLDSRHPILTELLESALAAFNPEDERATGGRLIGKKVKEMCRVDYLKELRFKECPEAKIKVAQPHVFCPVEEEKHWMLLDTNRATLVLRRMEEAAQGEEVRGLKLWSRHNGDFDSWGSSNRTSAVFEVAGMACPLMMQALGPNGIL